MKVVSRLPRRGRGDGERGAALVEFALILPLFMTLVLGMFTGGLAYNQKITMTNAAREGSRYASTLPVSNFSTTPPTNGWLHDVASYVENASEGVLGPGNPGWQVCVAYVYDDTATGGSNQTVQEVHPNPGNVFGTTPCFNDSRPADERRVQVAVSRNGKLEALFFTRNLNLRARSTTRFEAAP